MCCSSVLDYQLQHTATHCNTLQHTATHCNTLQHTATPYETTNPEKRHIDVLRKNDIHLCTQGKSALRCSRRRIKMFQQEKTLSVFFVFIESFFWFVFSTGFLFRVMRRLISREKMHVYHNNNHIQRYTHTHINLWCNWCTCTCVHTCTQDFSWLFGCVQVYVCVCVLTRCTSVLRWKWGSR